ncbi:MAG: sigma-70 family RNA polymerase sigma factor [Planctomycetes bacterium]|nr:sigma-70 family RNA polymerase sigma factor [Planctomycetota bacterium]
MTAEQAGDPGARDDVGERLASQVEWLRLALLHLAGRAVRAHAELDDLVQETLLRALGTRGGLPPSEAGETALRRLLAHLARHVVVDVARRLRADKRSGRVVRLSRADWSASGLSDSALPAATAGPFTRAAAADERRALEQAFLGLSPEHRRVLGLRRFLGLDARETARRMGRSESAVHSLYRRALAAWADARDVP